MKKTKTKIPTITDICSYFLDQKMLLYGDKKVFIKALVTEDDIDCITAHLSNGVKIIMKQE
jgi:hypothetical protein